MRKYFITLHLRMEKGEFMILQKKQGMTILWTLMFLMMAQITIIHGETILREITAVYFFSLFYDVSLLQHLQPEELRYFLRRIGIRKKYTNAC